MKTSSIRLTSAAAATLLGIGLSVGAGIMPAHAATTTVWDKVAACESSGNWAINTGNGFYGGLQFTPSTWRAFGGTAYAAYANEATRDEQITIAKKVLAAQGPGAWPVCSKKAGLTKSNGLATVVTLVSTSSAKKATVKKATVKKAATTAHASAASGSHATYVVVKSGDTLSKIAKAHRVSGGWKALWALNKSTLKSPNVLRVGQKIRVA